MRLGSQTRLIVATILFCAWFVGLLAGRTFGGAVHLALVAALAIFPWRLARGEER